MKPLDGYDKLRGGYYTPDKIAAFITNWAVRSAGDRVLEPSCGDGSFLNAISNRLRQLGGTQDQLRQNVTGVELDPGEAERAARFGAAVVCQDFFTYYQNKIDGVQQFDVIVGNPPFIRYQNFSETYRTTAFALLRDHDFHPNRLTNIWLPFLLLSCKALRPGGRVGMVIPAELFQVDYAAEARLFLSTYFDQLTFVTFQKLVFEDIQQEVVLLLGERASQRKGIRVVECDDLQDLLERGPSLFDAAEIKKLDHSQDKWVKYYLTHEELDLLAQLSHDPSISDAASLFEVNVGLVSGENAFFVVDQSTVEKHGLRDCVLPIISRAGQLKGVRLTKEDYDCLAAGGKKVFFFAPGDLPVKSLPKAQQKYIRWGEKQKFHQNYKCRIRPVWYHVPQTWLADAFLIRQANLYPKMILNQKAALVTDTLHKVRFLPGVNGSAVTAAFLNTYTFALSETIGRSYGGGVLTFEPGEMRKMRIPMAHAEELDLALLDRWQREGNIDKILAYTDEILLRSGLGLSEQEIALLHGIWVKLRDRRLARKNQSKRF